MKRYWIIVLVLVYGAMATMAVPPRRDITPNNPAARNTTARSVGTRTSAEPRLTPGTRLLPPKGLIILVNFQDVTFTTPASEIDSMFIGKHYTRDYEYDRLGEHFHYTSCGSVEQYFKEVSLGLYTPHFQVVGPVTVEGNMADYGGNTSGAEGSDKNPFKMVYEACKLADKECGVNFADYDSNGDNIVDYVYILYAGFGEADGGGSQTIWPHSYNLSKTAYAGLKLDSKTIDLYACSCELSSYSKQHDGIGTFCHEFSHVMGLPDVYSQDGSDPDFKTSGEWDLMDYGVYNNDGNTPCGYTAYERFFLGWSTPTILNTAQNDTLQPLYLSGESYIITANGVHNLIGNNPNPNEFYILENRQQIGWDSCLAAHGLLITKISYNKDYWRNNCPNYNRNNKMIDLIEADGKEYDYGDSRDPIRAFGGEGDCFPYQTTNFFTPYEQYPLTSIKEQADSTITFRFMGGVTPTDIIPIGQEKGDINKIMYQGAIYFLKGKKIYNMLGYEVHFL